MFSMHHRSVGSYVLLSPCLSITPLLTHSLFFICEGIGSDVELILDADCSFGDDVDCAALLWPSLVKNNIRLVLEPFEADSPKAYR